MQPRNNSRGSESRNNSRESDRAQYSSAVLQSAQSYGNASSIYLKAQPDQHATQVVHLDGPAHLPMQTTTKKRKPFLFPTSLERSEPNTTRSTFEVRQELGTMLQEMQNNLSASIKDQFHSLTNSLELGIQRTTKECFSELDRARPQQEQVGSKDPPRAEKLEAKALDHEYAGAQAQEVFTLEKLKRSSLEAQVDALQAQIAVNRARQQASGANVSKAAMDELSAIETIKRVVYMEAQVEELNANIAILKSQKQELSPQMESTALQSGPMEPKAVSEAGDIQGQPARAFHKQSTGQSRQVSRCGSRVTFASSSEELMVEEYGDQYTNQYTTPSAGRRSTQSSSEQKKWDILAMLAENSLVQPTDEEERQFAHDHWQQQALQRIVTRRSWLWQFLTWAQLVSGELPKCGPDTTVGVFVRGPVFGAFSMSAILANALLIGWETDSCIRDALQNRPFWHGWFIWNYAFTVYFVLELLFRIFANRLWFFLCPEYRWNIFDIVIVVCSIFTDMLANVNITFIRALRVFRIVRVARLVKVLKVFRNLRRVIFAIMACMESLAWCFLFLTMLVFMFSIFFLQGAADYLTHDPQPDVVDGIRDWYGSLPDAMFSMLLSLTGGNDWQYIMKPLNSIGWYYAAAFPLAIVFVNIGVINVLTGVFMENAAEATDRDMVVSRETARMESMMEEMLSLFAEFDDRAHGKINWTEFRKYLSQQHVQIYLAANNLETSHAHMLFHLLDEEGDGDIDIREFVIGLIRLSGDAKTVDVRIILHALCKLVFNVEAVEKSIAAASQNISDLSDRS